MISVSLVDSRDLERPQNAVAAVPPATAPAADVAPPATVVPPTPQTVEAPATAPEKAAETVDVVPPDPAIDVAILTRPPDIEVPREPQPERLSTHSVVESSAHGAATAEQASSETPATAAVVPVSPTVSVPPAASAGDVARYARAVAVALGKNRPRGIGRSGRVEIEFTITDGRRTIDRMHIARSSGIARLDDLAKAAIDRAALPEPPKGMTPSQRTFRVPFNFD